MNEISDQLKTIGEFLSEHSISESIGVNNRRNLRIYHHYIAERTFIFIEYQKDHPAQNHPKILVLLNVIDEQIKIFKTGKGSIEPLISSVRQLIQELDVILKPYIKAKNTNENQGVSNPQELIIDGK